MPSMDESTLYLQHLYFYVALRRWCASAWIFCTLCIFVHISHLHYLIVLRRPKNGRCFRRARRGISNFQWVAFCVYFVFAGSAPLLLGCSENGWCALASLKAAINWMSPQGKRQTWRRTLYPQDKYWCSHCCQTNTHDCHWLHTFQMYLQLYWRLFLLFSFHECLLRAMFANYKHDNRL